MNQEQSYTLSQITRRVGQVLAADPYMMNVWVTAETMDVRVSGGHCYLELIEKDNNGKQLAKVKATIWASTYYDLAAKFHAETGQVFRSDLKVMVRVSVNFHPVYGLSFNITGINSAYTLGDAMQRRMQMIEQLKREGIIEMNRTLPWPAVPQRIAIISARNAAGYGDFVNQLFTNPARLKFHAHLFPATLQGERTSQSIISALDRIAATVDQWDCVVIIRGGGATSELAAFDDYQLAANIAQFPIPVIIGIGHERDITLLDYVANMRVKTPTAAAEWLIQRGETALGRLQQIAAAMLQAVTDRMTGCHRQLALIQGQLPAVATNAVVRAQKRVLALQSALAGIGDKRLRPALIRLDALSQAIAQASQVATARQRQQLDSIDAMLQVLSPEATLKRGYTITRVAGHAISSVEGLAEGDVIETVMAHGTALSRLVSAKQ